MSIPHNVLAAGWVPFVVVTILVLMFSFVYIRYYQHRYDKELCSTLTAILGLALAMFTCVLVPVDIFLVSFMKNSNGTFKDWANDEYTRTAIENGVLYAYYALYSCVIVFLFFILPLSYFYYEEGDEDTTRQIRCCTAFKFSFVFMFMAIVLFLIGIFVPFKEAPNHDNGTDTEWDKIKNILHDLGNNHGENAFSFMISILSFFGYFTIVIYTGVGMGTWPVHLIKGRRSILREYREVTDRRAMTHSEIDALRNTTSRQLSSSERRHLQNLEDEEHLTGRRERHLEAAENSWLRKCSIALRPFQVCFGLFFILISVLIFMSLLLTNIDKLLHSLGPKMGYILPEKKLPNVLDIVLVFSQKVFPLDYILMIAIVFFLVFCSMGGVNAIGIWFLWIRMFKIRAGRTRPQGLLFLCYLLMYIVLALNILLYQMTPQYFTYGSQHYVANYTSEVNATLHHHTIACSTIAPQDDCIMTQIATLLYRFFYKIWFFGAAYYWLSWAFLAVYVISFTVAVIRKRRSSIEGEVEDDDTSDEDEEMIRNV